VKSTPPQPAAASAAAVTNAIELADVTFGYNRRQPVLKGITMTIPRGKVVAIMGGSGCGKTTILRLIGGQLRQQSGNVRVGGQSVRDLTRDQLFALRRRIGMLFQFGALFTDMTVFENVAFPMREHTDLADSLIQSRKFKRVLVIGADVHTPFMPWQNGWDVTIGTSDREVTQAERDENTKYRDRTVLFGDGAGAVVVEASESDERGYLAAKLYTDGSNIEALYVKGILKFSIRRPPVVDPSEPLRGMTIVVDPGHPPIGATGPTGLWEPVPTLAVGLRVRDLLQARGAHVVMTRTGAGPVALGDRPIFARRANANAFVSIHLNADADGQNPFRDNGTGTYYFHPHSRLLARSVQDSLVPELGLRDRGIFYQNLAVCRPTWFPAVLAEGLFIIMPDQESAIKTPEYQEAYARGVVGGLEKFFATFER